MLKFNFGHSGNLSHQSLMCKKTDDFGNKQGTKRSIGSNVNLLGPKKKQKKTPTQTRASTRRPWAREGAL